MLDTIVRIDIVSQTQLVNMSFLFTRCILEVTTCFGLSSRPSSEAETCSHF